MARDPHRPRDYNPAVEVGKKPLKDPSRTVRNLVQEKAVLVGVVLPDSPPRGNRYDPLTELHALAEAAGAEVVDKLIQRREKIAPATYIGKGKVEALAECVARRKADVVIFDNELSPSQIRELEEVARCKVLDRTELIL